MDSSVPVPASPAPPSVDARLVELLILDGRASYTDLAKSVGLGVDAVQQRVQKLEQSGQIKVVGSVAPEVMSYRTSGMVGLWVSGPSNAVALAAAAHPMTHFVACCAGEFDIAVELVCQNDQEFQQACDYLRKIEGVTALATFLYLSVERFAYTQVALDSVTRGHIATLQHTTVRALDEKDIAIVSALRQNGRASFAELAAPAGLTYASARRRTTRLLEEGIVRINTLVSPFLSEQRVMALIGIRVKGNLPMVISHLQDVLAIGLIAVITGRNNLLLEVTCSSRNDLVKFLDSKLAPIPEVIGFEVNQYLSVQKLPPQWTGKFADPNTQQFESFEVGSNHNAV